MFSVSRNNNHIAKQEYIKGLDSKVPEYVKEAIDLINEGFPGEGVYIVGGAVRDLITGKKPKDFDLVSNIDFDDLKELFESYGWDSDETGKTFGVLRVRKYGEEIEIAKFRKDIHDGENKTRVEDGNMSEDAHRRDLTINALYLEYPSGKIHDPTGMGIYDIKNKRIRFVGDPDTRLKEDYSRLLRFFKFIKKMGFNPDPESFEAVKRNIVKLKDVSSDKLAKEIETVTKISEIMQSIKDEIYNEYAKKVKLKFPPGLKDKDRDSYAKQNPEILIEFFKNVEILKDKGFIPNKKDLSFIRDRINYIGLIEGEKLQDNIERMTKLISQVYGVSEILGYGRSKKSRHVKANENRKEIAHTSGDMDKLREIIEDDNFYVRFYMAENPNKLSRDIIERLAKDDVGFIRGALTVRNDLPEDILWDLASDKETHVRKMVALRTDNLEVLKKLINDPTPSVYRLAYKNSHLPIDLLMAGYEKDDIDITEAIANNSKTPDRLLKRIYDDYGSTNNKITIALIRNKNTPDSVLIRILEDNPYNEDYWEEMADRDAVSPQEVYDLIISSRKQQLYTILINSIYTPIKVIRELLKHGDFLVLVGAAKKLIREDLLEEILDNADNRLAREHTLFEVMIALASNPAATTRILDKALAIIDKEEPGDRYKDSAKEAYDKILEHPNVNPLEVEERAKRFKRRQRKTYYDNFSRMDLDKHWDLKSKNHPDLELLKRLKGHLKNYA